MMGPRQPAHTAQSSAGTIGDRLRSAPAPAGGSLPIYTVQLVASYSRICKPSLMQHQSPVPHTDPSA